MTDESLIGVLSAQAEQHPDRVWLMHRDRSLTYSETLGQVLRLGGGFRDSGIRQGDRVALLLHNSIEFVLSWFALSALGAVHIPINTAYKRTEVAFHLTDGDVQGIVADQQTAAVATQALADTEQEAALWLAGGTTADDRSLAVLSQADPVKPLQLGAEDPCAILYTSGTTGEPKGCVQPQRFFLNSGRLLSRVLGLREADVLVTPLPLFHMNPHIAAVMDTLVVGCSLAIFDRFHPTSFIHDCREVGATVICYMGVMPAMLMGLPPSPADRDHQIRVALGAAIPPKLHEPFEQRFGFPCVESYGQTETSVATTTWHDGERLVGTGCVGKAAPDMELKLIGRDGAEIKGGGSGELLVRGPSVMREYWRRPTETAKAFSDGWFHTGDMLRRDEEGRYFFLDRIRDVVRRSGENISSLEVEKVIRQHDAVSEVAVIGVPDEIRGQELKAFVQLVPGAEIRASDLANFVEERLAYFKVPRFWQLRDELPLTPTLKTRKEILRQEQPSDTTWDRNRNNIDTSR